MGGIGSGRHWRWDGGPTTDNFRMLDVRRWKREGFLEPVQTFGWQWCCDGEPVASIRARSEQGRVWLIYRHSQHEDEWQEENYPVYLDTTDCHLGGERVWFLCPARGCGRRVAKLYGGSVFACRHCHRISYPSQREDRSSRLLRRADGIRAKLGWEPGTGNGHGPKPKGMHWKTFNRLVAKHDDLSDRGWRTFMSCYGAVIDAM